MNDAPMIDAVSRRGDNRLCHERPIQKVSDREIHFESNEMIFIQLAIFESLNQKCL